MDYKLFQYEKYLLHVTANKVLIDLIVVNASHTCFVVHIITLPTDQISCPREFTHNITDPPIQPFLGDFICFWESNWSVAVCICTLPLCHKFPNLILTKYFIFGPTLKFIITTESDSDLFEQISHQT